MSSPQYEYRWETAPTWIERRLRLEKTAEILMKLFVLTAPVGAGFVRDLQPLGLWTSQANAEAAFDVSSALGELADLIHAYLFVVWIIAVAVWLGSHLLRPHDPLCFERMPFALMFPSVVFYFIALIYWIGA